MLFKIFLILSRKLFKKDNTKRKTTFFENRDTKYAVLSMFKKVNILVFNFLNAYDVVIFS